jgi:hypothetical protein
LAVCVSVGSRGWRTAALFPTSLSYPPRSQQEPPWGPDPLLPTGRESRSGKTELGRREDGRERHGVCVDKDSSV